MKRSHVRLLVEVAFTKRQKVGDDAKRRIILDQEKYSQLQNGISYPLTLPWAGNCYSRSDTFLDFITATDELKRIIFELWLEWYIAQTKIQQDGSVGGYIEECMPGWLVMQWGRSLWPQRDDVWVTISEVGTRLVAFGSCAIEQRLDREPKLGYLVDRLDFSSWKNITDYGGNKCPKPRAPKFVEPGEEIPASDPVAYQVIPASRYNSTKDVWVTLPDMNDQCWWLDGICNDLGED